MKEKIKRNSVAGGPFFILGHKSLSKPEDQTNNLWPCLCCLLCLCLCLPLFPIIRYDRHRERWSCWSLFRAFSLKVQEGGHRSREGESMWMDGDRSGLYCLLIHWPSWEQTDERRLTIQREAKGKGIEKGESERWMEREKRRTHPSPPPLTCLVPFSSLVLSPWRTTLRGRR